MALTLTAAGAALAEYDAVYINSLGQAAKADADSAATMPVLTLVKEDGGIAGDATGEFYQICDEITNAAWSWTVGDFIYASVTAGGLSQTAPTASGDQVQIVGFATAATKMVLYPQLVLVEIA